MKGVIETLLTLPNITTHTAIFILLLITQIKSEIAVDFLIEICYSYVAPLVNWPTLIDTVG